MTAVRAAARLVSSIGVLSPVLENLSTHTLRSDPRTQNAGDGPACHMCLIYFSYHFFILIISHQMKTKWYPKGSSSIFQVAVRHLEIPSCYTTFWNIPSCRTISWNIPSCRMTSWNIPSCCPGKTSWNTSSCYTSKTILRVIWHLGIFQVVELCVQIFA